jgi:predicted HicB family RNase H-like nuclease
MNADASIRRSFPLRLAKSLKETASTHARKDGVSLNHFINLAVAEKISRLSVTAHSATDWTVSDRKS